MSFLFDFVYLKMHLPGCVFMSILLMVADGFTVKGPSGPLVVPLGASVLLPCSVDTLSSMEDLEVQWRRSDSETLVHLFQDGDVRPEVQQQEYHDRAHLFTENIKHGNFSLLLENVRAEDKGKYTCKVYSGQDSAETVVEIQGVGFSALHIMVLILCITACGSALLICCLIYCRSNNTVGSVFRLQMFLVFCPNIIMFFAFVLWGVSEGSVNESVCCSALYILRPLMLLWAAPYNKEFTGQIETLVLYYIIDAEYIFFTTVVYSVLFKSALDKGLSYAGFEGVVIMVLFGIVLLFCLFYIIYLLARLSGKLSERMKTIFNVLSGIIFDVLPSLQFILLFYLFGSTRGGFIIVAVLPVITTVTRYDWNVVCGDQMGCSPLVRRSVWSVLMLLMNAVLIYFYIIALENEKDRVGWVCMIVFLQMLWTVWNVLLSFRDWEFTRIMSVYVFGSVGVVLISAVALMTELILKTVNGEGLVGDLRVAVFSSESLFSLSLLILVFCAPWIKKDLQCCQKAGKSNEASSTGSAQNQGSQNQNTTESHEMNPLMNTQEAGKADSVETQT